MDVKAEEQGLYMVFRKPKLKLLMLMVSLCCSPQVNSMWLGHFLMQDAQKEEFWRSRNLNLLEVEENLYRNLRFIVPFHGNWINFLVHDEGVDQMNLAIYHGLLQNKQMLLNAKDNLSSVLEQLPTLEAESYRGLRIPDALWQSLQVGRVYHEPGFMQASGSLYHAYQDAMSWPESERRVVIKIEGQNAILMNFLYQDDDARMLWKQNSFFEVVERDYKQEHRLGFLHLREITHQEARENGVLVNQSDMFQAGGSCL